MLCPHTMNIVNDVHNVRSGRSDGIKNLENGKLIYSKDLHDSKNHGKHQSQHQSKKHDMDRPAFHPSTRLDRSLQLNEQAGSGKANKRRTVGETRRGRSAAAESVNDTRGMCEGNSHRVTAGRRDGDRSRDQMNHSERNASTLSGEDSLANTSCSLYTVHQRWEMMMAAQVELIEDLERLSTNQTCKSIKSSFTSSEEFRTVMDDLYGTKDGKFDLTSSQKQNVSQPNSASNKLTTAVKTIGIVKNLEETNKHRSLPIIRNFRVENARRRWGKIRSHVREMAAKRRIGKATLNWAMLRHMVKGMTNPDRAKQDLYIRYGLVPIILNDGRTIKKNIMLSNRLQVNGSSRQICSAKQNRVSRQREFPKTSFLARLLNNEHQ